MDFVTKAYAYDQTVRIYVATSKELVEDARKKHSLWPTSAAALGRTLTIAAIMGLTYKDDDELLIKINGNGPIGDIVVGTNSKGEVRGYVSNPEVFIEYNNGPLKGHLNVGYAVGTDGFIYVTKDLKMGKLFTSSAALQTGEIAEDFTYYFAASEQIPSSVGLGVLVDTDNSIKQAGGFLLQLMPGVTDETISTLESIIKNIKPVTEMLENNLTHEDIIGILSNNDYQILEKKDICFKCDCNKERFRKGLKTLDEETLDTLINEDGKAETVCHFCNSKYLFTKEELIAIKEEKK